MIRCLELNGQQTSGVVQRPVGVQRRQENLQGAGANKEGGLEEATLEVLLVLGLGGSLGFRASVSPYQVEEQGEFLGEEGDQSKGKEGTSRQYPGPARSKVCASSPVAPGRPDGLASVPVRSLDPPEHFIHL